MCVSNNILQDCNKSITFRPFNVPNHTRDSQIIRTKNSIKRGKLGNEEKYAWRINRIMRRISLRIIRFTTSSGGSVATSNHKFTRTFSMSVWGFTAARLRSPVCYPTQRVFSWGIERWTTLGCRGYVIEIVILTHFWWIDRFVSWHSRIDHDSWSWDWDLKIIKEFTFPGEVGIIVPMFVLRTVLDLIYFNTLSKSTVSKQVSFSP